jgi:hypothetical protein
MAAVAINYFAYNFIKIHRSLRMSPAMAAGVVDRLFDVSDLVNLLIEAESNKAAYRVESRRARGRQRSVLTDNGAERRPG